MGKSYPDSILQKDLDYIASVCNMIVVCNAHPATYADVATYALADVVVDAGDFTIQDHTPDGREFVIAAQNGVEVDVTGTASHIALIDTVGEELLPVTICASQPLTDGLFFNIPSFKIIKPDAT